ncbi:MAG: GH25 family lysozyme [Clostridia bacterium]|nr:GH25 family lysozyme [Clostridia bacterium]
MEKIKLKLFFWMLLFCVISFTFQYVNAFAPSSDVIYNGIDVSEFQGYIDYSRVREAGIEVVYIRSSEGTSFVDPYFRMNYDNAKANGLKVGFYHYVTSRSIEEAIVEADFFVSVIEGTSPDCKLAMDFEYFNGLNNDEINQIAETFLSRVKEVSGKDVVIYSDAYNAEATFEESLAIYPIWVADYFVDEPASNGKWEYWVGFQYSDVGSIDGINGNVDLDKFTEDIFLDNTGTIVNSGNDVEPSNDINEITVIVKSGDTLSALAYQYGTTVQNIVNLNNIQNPNVIYIGQRILIRTTNNAISNSDTKVYIVKYGDTLNAIARKYNVTVQSIAIENHITNPNYIYVGQRLIIEDVRYDRHETGHSIYVVRPGDTLSQIALRYGVTVDYLVNLNSIMNPNLIYVGENLRV